MSTAFTNGFVNMGFGTDKLLSEEDKAHRWFTQIQSIEVTTGKSILLTLHVHGMYRRTLGNVRLSHVALFFSTASVGLVYRWDIEGGLNRINGYFDSDSEYMKVSGAIIDCVWDSS